MEKRDYVLIETDFVNIPKLTEMGYSFGDTIQVPFEVDGEILVADAQTVDQTVVEPVTEEAAVAPVQNVPAEKPRVFYGALEVVERLERVSGDGRECRLSDGTTAFVPLTVLGE